MARTLVAKEEDSQSPSGSSGNPEQKTTKRRCVQSACVPCRKRKSKCDGGTPVCATCTAVYKTECYYDAESENRRGKAAQKRDSASIAEPSAAADIIIASIRTLPESEVQEIVQQIRKDDNLDALAESLRKIVTLPPKSDGQGSLEGDLSVLIGKPQVSQSGVARHYGHTSSLGLVHEDENYSKPRNTSPISSNQDAWTTVTNDVQFLYHLFDLYFRWSHPFYVLFSRECFYKDFKSGRQKYCSPLLVNAICAYACHFSDIPAARTDPNNPRTAGDHFFAEAKRLLYEDESPCLTTVQALAVMGLREPSAGRDSTGFMYAGRCLRMAVELGLHLNYSSTANLDLSRSEVEVRKVTFWGCFTYDTAWSLAIGRISQLPRTAINLDKPILDEPVSLDKFQPFLDPSQRAEKGSQPGVLTNRQFLQQLSTLSELVNDAVFMFYAPRERFTSRRLLDCYNKYTNWYKSLPKALQMPDKPDQNPPPPHVITLHMYFHTCYLHLFRPLLKVDLLHSDIRPRDMCIQSANKIADLMTIYRQHYSLRTSNILLTHILLSTSLVHLINQTSDLAASNLAQGLRDLEDLSICHHFGARAFKIIYALARKWGLPFPDDILKTSKLIPLDDPLTSPPSNNFFTPLIPPSTTHAPAADYAPTAATTAAAAAAASSSAASSSAASSSATTSSAEDPTRRESLTMFASTSPTQPHHHSHGLAARSAAPAPGSLPPNLLSNAALSFPPSVAPAPAAPAEKLFWTPFAGQGIPLLGNNMHVSPMDLRNMLGAVDEWDSFSRDGFKISDSWGQEPVVFGGNGVGVSGEMGGMEGMGGAAGPVFGEWWSGAGGNGVG